MAQAQNKTVITDQKVEDFLETITDEQQKLDSYTLVQIMEEETKEKAKMWGSSIIGFKSYTYKYDSGRVGESFKVGFSPRKGSISLYLIGCMDQSDSIKTLLSTLGKYKQAKACIYIKKLSDVNKTVLQKLIHIASETKLTYEV